MRRLITVSLAVAALLCGMAARAKAEAIIALYNGGVIYSFDSSTPEVVSAPRIITGLRPGERIWRIDFRPATGQLYGISNQGRIYTIDTEAGAATFVLSLSPRPITPAVGFDFDPVEDRLLVVAPITNASGGLRINVDTGEVISAGTLGFAPGDPNFGQRPVIVGAAYTNNFAGATSTTLYGIHLQSAVSSRTAVLVIQNPTDTGTFHTIGSLVSFFLSGSISDSDISGATGIAYFTVQGDFPSTALYTVNLSTGRASRVGTIGVPQGPLAEIAAPVGAVQTQPAP